MTTTTKALRRVRVSFFLHHVIWLGIYDFVLPVLSDHTEALSRSLSPAHSTPPSPPEETPVASSSKSTSRRSKAETKGSKSTIKAKGKTKAKAKVGALAAVEGEDVEMHDGDKKAVAKESDPPEEEDNDSGEEELEDVEERKAASKRCVFKCLYSQCSFFFFFATRFPTNVTC